MQNMMGLITKQEAIDLINGLHSYDDKFFVENLAKALSSTGKLNTRHLSCFINIFSQQENINKVILQKEMCLTNQRLSLKLFRNI